MTTPPTQTRTANPIHQTPNLKLVLLREPEALKFRVEGNSPKKRVSETLGCSLEVWGFRVQGLRVSGSGLRALGFVFRIVVSTKYGMRCSRRGHLTARPAFAVRWYSA